MRSPPPLPPASPIQGTGDSETYKVDLNAYRLAYELSKPAIVIPAGSTSKAVTLTARNDYDDLPDAGVTFPLSNHPAKYVTPSTTTATKWVSKGTSTAPTITITDDDELGQVTGVSAVQKTRGGNRAGGAVVRWTKVANATGYVVEWKTGTQIYDSSRQLRRPATSTLTTFPPPASPSARPTTSGSTPPSPGSDQGLPSDEIQATYGAWLDISTTTISIQEGASTSYTIKLGGQPSTTTTLLLAATSTDPALSTTTLNYTTLNWTAPADPTPQHHDVDLLDHHLGYRPDRHRHRRRRL